jgi:pimeloyl-ACP methyl ester carboxylesterase
VRSLYRSVASQQTVQQWCLDRLNDWNTSHTRSIVNTTVGPVHTVSTGTTPPAVVVVPGTTFNSAHYLCAMAALADHWPTMVIDLPGQPGLSTPQGPRRRRTAWYARALTEVLDAVDARDAIVVGNSLGAAVALWSSSPRIAARLLYSPAGIVSLKTGTTMIRASTAWLLRPRLEHSRQLLRLFTSPGTPPPSDLVEWMHLVSMHCRVTLSPPPLPPDLLRAQSRIPLIVATGEHDRLLPPARLRPAVLQHLRTELVTLPGVGHLALHERPTDLLPLIDRLTEMMRR